MLYQKGRIGTLELPNRFVRSATAEALADPDGRPKPALQTLYKELVQGGVGLIITGHMYVHPSGKAHPEMTGVYSDELIPDLTELITAVHQVGGKAVVQINHGGLQCEGSVVAERMGPSAIAADFVEQPVREMTQDEIEEMIAAYGDAAGRVQAAGFDGVQIHGAHGYLVSQFLSPFMNRRTDEWGGDLEGRMRFLRSICRAIRERVGPDYPVLIKLGLRDAVEGGLSLQEGLQIVAALEGMGIDGLEISGGVSGGTSFNTRFKIRTEADEGYFRPWARQARQVTELPIILVGGFRSRGVMEATLDAGEADFISLCRPLICEPDLPNQLQVDPQKRSLCISTFRCWPKEMGEGIACRCTIEREA